MPRLTPSPLAACRSALLRALNQSAPGVATDNNGYVDMASANLIEGIDLSDFEADLRQGDGNELEGKFRAAHSSSALAVNTFAPFKNRLADLHLPAGGSFELLCFERKCHHGLAGRRAPNLDVLLESPNEVVAIESKCLEPLTPHIAKFAQAYEAMSDRKSVAAWFEEMRRLTRAPRTNRWLDAAQLIKHAFGLAHTFPDRGVTLLYLFWEPSNPDAYPMFGQHRDEVRRFAKSVQGGKLKFTAMSYPELWAHWRTGLSAEWLRTHIARLEARYSFAI